MGVTQKQLSDNYMNLNIVIMSGNLTRDPELRYTNSGIAVCSYTVAVNDARKGDSGVQEKDGPPYFLQCTSFGKQAEAVAKFCSKGTGVLVEGRMKTDEWTDKQTGEKHRKDGCIVNGCQFLTRVNTDRENIDRVSHRTEPEPQGHNNYDDDDVPF
jgi:single-strand DNA-binding protein